MAERVSYQNVESLVLQQSLCALTTAIIADLTQVASRLFEKHVISRAELRRAQLSTRPIDERANELVTQVLDQVKLNPEKFDAFMNALQESDVQQSVIRDVQDKYKDQKTKASRIEKFRTGTHSDGECDSPSSCEVIQIKQDTEILKREHKSLQKDLKDLQDHYCERSTRLEKLEEENTTLKKDLHKKDAELCDKDAELRDVREKYEQSQASQDEKFSSTTHRYGNTSNRKDELLQMKEEKVKLEGRNKSSKRELKHLRGTYNEGSNRLEEVEEENTTLKRELDNKNAELCDMSAEISEKGEALKVVLNDCLDVAEVQVEDSKIRLNEVEEENIILKRAR